MYATLDEFNEYLRGLDTTIDDNVKKRLLEVAEKVIINATGWEFEPYRRTYNMDAPMPPVEPGFGSDYFQVATFKRPTTELRLSQPLLTLESGYNGDGTALVLSDLRYLDSSIYPRYALAFKKSSGLEWLPNEDGEYTQVIQLTGLWGYHEAWDEAFTNSLDTLQLALDDNETVVTVAQADGVNAEGFDLRFQVGKIIKLEDENGYEYMYIAGITLGTDPAPDTLTVMRGYRGTTARAWNLGTALYVYKPMPGVTQATMEVARLIYRRRDLDSGDSQQILGTNIRVFPETLPDYVNIMLPGARNWL